MAQMIPVLLYHQEIDRTQRIFIRDRVLEHTFPLHSHDFYELELITGGAGRNWINSFCVPIRQGSLYLLSPSDVHRMEVDETLTLQSIQFLPEVPGSLGLPEIRNALFTQLDPEDCAIMLNHCDHIHREEARGGALSLQSMSASLALMLIHLLRHGTTYAPAASSKRMQEALEYIQRHRSDAGLRLSDVAESCGLSVCHFSTTFHSVVGCSFSEYLTQTRLRHACALLASSTSTVTEIAYESGFSSLSHFFRVFRAHHHCTPLEYRRIASARICCRA